MREDGTMMRTPELIELAKKYDMKFITIKGLQDYRKRHEKLVDCEAVSQAFQQNTAASRPTAT